MRPTRLFFDTNVYILGAADPASPEGQVLRWAGFETGNASVEIVVSDEVFDQIRRVGRRVRGKDWASELLARLWRNVRLVYVLLEPEAWAWLPTSGLALPREDLSVYLTARVGQAQCFISANHKLIAALAQQTGEFECLKPVEFVAQYLVR